MHREVTMRVARPSDRLEDVVRFYTRGLGLSVLGWFEDHEGFDGVIVGTAGAPYHLEFTRERGQTAGDAPTRENLLVFYIPGRAEWDAAVARMHGSGYEPVASVNPYWDRDGLTFEDPDGYRVVLQNASWP